MKYIQRVLVILALAVFSMTTVLGQFDTLKVMYYNSLNYPDGGDPNREVYFRAVNEFIRADVILISELTSEAGANTLLNEALNVFGTSHYQRAAYTDGPDTDNMLFYNSDKLGLHSQWYIPTSLRYINEYVLYYKSDDLQAGGDTIFFYFYSAHLKAFPEDSIQRLNEVGDFKARVNSLVGAENIFFGGDLNLYTNQESAYQSLIDDGLYPLNDPLPAGDWHANYTYRYIHTQSTRTASFGGGSTGGLDDRFDFILFSDDVLSGNNRVMYLDNSCEAFGNDGNHYNFALIDPPVNPNIPDSVTDALYYMSDHLPVVCDLLVEAVQDTTQSNLVISEIMYNPPEAGQDSLEFIEMYNNGSEPENVGGYYFDAGVNYTFPSLNVDPGEFLVVSINSEAMLHTFGINALQWDSDGLNNGGELILLKDNSGKTVDSVFYSDSSPWPFSPDGDGPSLILCDPGVDNALGANWSASANFVTNNGNGDPIYATPGFSECGYPPVADFTANTLEIYPGELVSFTDLSLNDPNSWNWTFEGGTPSASNQQNPVITYNAPGIFDVGLTVSNSSGSDTKTNIGYITVIDDSPTLIVSEIMQNPSDVPDSEGEWFEVYNPTNNPIDMMDWTIKDNDVDLHVIASSVIVPAKGFAVLGINSNSTANGGYTCNYQYSNFYLGNGADEIILMSPDDTEIDRVEYDGGSNWPDPNGSSMIFTGTGSDDNNLYTNWSTASAHEPTYQGTTGDNGSPGTNGTGQNLIPAGFNLQLTVFLEGPYNGAEMYTVLQNSVEFPLSQPYDISPWNYSGTESVGMIPNPNVVDWVLVELRDAADVLNATTASTIDKRAAFLLNNGHIVNLDGTSNLSFNLTVTNGLFIVVHHRNSISIISANSLTETGGVYTYDFSSGSSQAYNNGQKEIAPGVWGMYAGDCDASGLIDETDKSIDWEAESGLRGYFNADLNLDTQVDNIDKNEFWEPNLGVGTQVPQ